MSEHARVQFPFGHGPLDRSYWLSRCDGFLVHGADGMRIGRVVELHYWSRLDQPDELSVRGGLFGLRRLTYPVEAIAEIRAPERRLTLAAADVANKSEQHRPHQAA